MSEDLCLSQGGTGIGDPRVQASLSNKKEAQEWVPKVKQHMEIQKKNIFLAVLPHLCCLIPPAGIIYYTHLSQFLLFLVLSYTFTLYLNPIHTLRSYPLLHFLLRKSYFHAVGE